MCQENKCMDVTRSGLRGAEEGDAPAGRFCGRCDAIDLCGCGRDGVGGQDVFFFFDSRCRSRLREGGTKPTAAVSPPACLAAGAAAARPGVSPPAGATPEGASLAQLHLALGRAEPSSWPSSCSVALTWIDPGDNSGSAGPCKQHR